MGRRIWWVAHQHTPDPTYKCHACYLKTSNGLPEGYEGCETIKEVAARKKELESQQATPVPTTPSLSGQSRIPSQKKPNSSRQFSTYRVTWNSAIDSAPREESLQIAEAQTNEHNAVAEREARRTNFQERYVNDSESREKKGAAERSLSHAEKNDPEYISSRREKMREYKYRSYHHNPKFRESVLDSNRRYQTAMMKDPAWRAAHNERTRLRRKSVRKEDPSYVQRDTVCRWIRRDPAAREVMDWGLYKPVLYPIKVEHQCGGCEYPRRGGFKLWFLKQVKGRTESTDSGSTGLHRCPRCFFKDPDGGLPKAFEDCTTQTQLKTRLRELQGSRKG
ncbi:unnamed protein product [Aureobasidium pullulans]|nr:unnamed protein product [Aureobasidium pullulans]